LSITGRYEFFNDPDGFLSGPYYYNGKVRGLKINGFTAGVEFRPIEFAYFRVEYRFLDAAKGNYIFYSNTSDLFQALTFTTGVRF